MVADRQFRKMWQLILEYTLQNTRVEIVLDDNNPSPEEHFAGHFVVSISYSHMCLAIMV